MHTYICPYIYVFYDSHLPYICRQHFCILVGHTKNKSKSTSAKPFKTFSKGSSALAPWCLIFITMCVLFLLAVCLSLSRALLPSRSSCERTHLGCSSYAIANALVRLLSLSHFSLPLSLSLSLSYTHTHIPHIHMHPHLHIHIHIYNKLANFS